MDQSLASLLQKKQKQSKIPGVIDWDDRKKKYVTAVNELYEQLQAMLAEPISQGIVTLQQRSKQLTESYIGTYAVDDLILLIGGEQVRFSPCGRNIAGAYGRVDVVGERNEATLILRPESHWSFVQSRQPQLSVVPLTEATLAEVLQLVMRD